MDGLFVRALAKELHDNLKEGRIDTISQLNKTDFVFSIRTPGKSNNLYISVSYNNPTVFLSPKKFEKPETTLAFMMFLRKHLEGSFIKSISQLNNDRIIEIITEQTDDFNGFNTKKIIIELIGRFSNLLVLDKNNVILDAVKELSVLETTSRGIMRGLVYEAPYANKVCFLDKEKIKNIFKLDADVYSKKIVDSVMGVSPILGDYLESKYKNSSLDFAVFLIDELNKFCPTYTESSYYYFDIFNSQNKKYFTDLSSLLFYHYEKEAERIILKDNNRLVYRTVKTNLKRVDKKISKLEEELRKDEKSDDLRLKGELLLSNINKAYDKTSKLTLNNYYTNEEIIIDIDPLKSIKDNANQYFKRYKKSKAAVAHLIEQIEVSKNEKDYLEQLSYQLDNASLKDIIEIKKELIDNQYLFLKDSKAKKKNIKPNFLTFDLEGTKIYVGKNNIQNNYLTHAFAQANDLWFHVKDGHGSHVIVRGENKYSEKVIRYAAKLASEYSSFKNGSSVPVDYTEIKYIKKVPGKKGSFVTYKKYKTIYIDP